MKNKRFRKGDLVWFVDIGREGAFPECADFETRTTDERIVMNAYFGLLTLPKECCYHSKEECQEAIEKADLNPKDLIKRYGLRKKFKKYNKKFYKKNQPV